MRSVRSMNIVVGFWSLKREWGPLSLRPLLLVLEVSMPFAPAPAEQWGVP